MPALQHQTVIRPAVETINHVAFLRGINVGRHQRVGMAELRIQMSALGFSNVRTVLNSGNVIFQAPVCRRPWRDAVKRPFRTKITMLAITPESLASPDAVRLVGERAS